jgi:exosortase A-associated hydrolase 2
MSSVLQPAFVTGSTGRLFVSCFAPSDGSHSWLLFVPPFAEEMNKSRRMIARLGHALASQGVGVCLPDLYGTGDSEGEFGDASLPIWQRDLHDVADWLQRERGCSQLFLGGLRYGALLLMDSMAALPPADGFLLWQPLAKGQQQIIQYLRLRQAAAIMGGGKREAIAQLQARLDSGEPLEAGGYLLAPELVHAMNAQRLAALAPPADSPVHWLELSRDPQRPVTPVSAQVLEAWRSHGCQPEIAGVEGEPFWTTQELVDAPRLVDASVNAVLEMCR